MDGHQVIVEADSPQQLAETVRAMLATQPKPKTMGELVAEVILGGKKGVSSSEDEDSKSARNPRGHNSKLVLQALAAAGQAGMLQAHVQQWIRLNKHEDLAISSVRHALNQLQGRGYAMRTGDLWRISGNGVRELGTLEDLDLIGMDFADPPEEEDEDLPF